LYHISNGHPPVHQLSIVWHLFDEIDHRGSVQIYTHG